MFSKLTNISHGNKLLIVGIIVTVVGVLLMITAGSLGLNYKKVGEYVPVSTTPITPSDLVCTNISRTLTYGFPWSTTNDIARFIFRLNIGYLPPSGNPNDPFLPTSLMVLKNGSRNIFEFRYQSKKLFLDYYDSEGYLTTTLSIDIKPTYDDKFYVSASIMGYEDIGSNKLGSISLYDEYGTTQVSEMYRNLFTSSRWGNNTTLEIKGNNVVDSVQVCQKQQSNNFFNIPLGYQITFIIVIVILFILLIVFILPSKVRRSIGLGLSSESVSDYVVHKIQ